MRCIASKCAVVVLLLLSSLAAWSENERPDPQITIHVGLVPWRPAATPAAKYGNLQNLTQEDNGLVGWGSCVPCAGGSSDNATLSSSPFQTSPSVDGSSRDFYINGEAYSDGLWWYKVGPNDAATNFQEDFWLNVAANTESAQALEFDTYQFKGGREYMFGTQCDYASHTWDVWNSEALKWNHTDIPCKKFSPNTWYHLTFNFHRTSPDDYEHYDNLTIVEYNRAGKILARNVYSFNKAFPAQWTPRGWSDDLGVQFQMDIGGAGGQMREWVDEVSLTAW